MAFNNKIYKIYKILMTNKLLQLKILNIKIIGAQKAIKF